MVLIMDGARAYQAGTKAENKAAENKRKRERKKLNKQRNKQEEDAKEGWETVSPKSAKAKSKLESDQNQIKNPT